MIIENNKIIIIIIIIKDNLNDFYNFILGIVFLFYIFYYNNYFSLKNN